MENNYTQICEDKSWSLNGDEEDIGKKVLQFLQEYSETATFGARLKRFVAKECGVSEDSVPQYLKGRLQAEEIDMNSNTLRNWFSKAGPKKGDHSRDLMLRVAFALRLNVEQTNLLFQKVYLDRGLYPRRFEEYAAEFCLREGLGWTVWQSLLKQYPSAEEENEQTVYTRVLQQDLDGIKTPEEAAEYWKKHFHNFTIRNKSAREVLQNLVRKVKGNKDRTGEIDRELEGRNDKSDIWFEILKGRPHDTYEAMVQVITELTPETQSNGKKSRSILKGTCLPHEIQTNFPEASVFSKKDPSYEELRKMIILLGSYYLWRQAARARKILELDVYIQEMNDRLNEAGLPPLYYGNPFDWLFLYSAKEEDPLAYFREVLAEAMDEKM